MPSITIWAFPNACQIAEIAPILCLISCHMPPDRQPISDAALRSARGLDMACLYGAIIFSIRRVSRARAAISLRISTKARDRRPCFQDGCDGPSGCPPPAPCIRQTRQPFTGALRQRLPVRLLRAMHCPCKGLRHFSSCPLPPCFTLPTIACAPASTVTCSTRTVCDPPFRYLRRASTWATKVRASLLTPV